MDIDERRRRHDEHFQKEVPNGLVRILDVLHDISDTVSAPPREPSSPPRPEPDDQAPDENTLLSTSDLAAILGVSPSSVYTWRAARRGPTATRIGTAIRYQRADVDRWLAESREDDSPATQPWNQAFTPGRIGSSHPSSSEVNQRPYCDGSHSEPRAASKYSGRGFCRVCGDDVIINRDGGLRKHRPWRRF